MDEFDVKQYELEDVGVLTLKNARGDDDLLVDGAPVRVEIYSPGSPQGVKALHKAGRATQLTVFRTLRGEIDARDAENADRVQIEKLVGFTKSISANWRMSPSDTYGNTRLVYINKQLEDFIGKFANFSKGSSPS